MSDAWSKRKDALEEDYFQRREREALERLSKHSTDKPRLSPITGKPMTQQALHGVVVDQCPDTGGIWLDAGELEQIVELMKKQEPSALENFFAGIMSSFKTDK